MVGADPGPATGLTGSTKAGPSDGGAERFVLSPPGRSHPQDQSPHQVTIIYRQEIPAVIKIPPTFIRALVVCKVISILKEGFEDFFPASCFWGPIGNFRP